MKYLFYLLPFFLIICEDVQRNFSPETGSRIDNPKSIERAKEGIAPILISKFANKSPTKKSSKTGIKPQGKIYQIKLNLNPEFDNTALLQAQLDSIPNGTIQSPIIIKFPEGRFWTEGNFNNDPRGLGGVIKLTKRSNLIIRGDSTTFYTKAPAVSFEADVRKNTHSRRRHFWLVNCSNIVIENVNIEGSNYTFQKDIALGSPWFWKTEYKKPPKEDFTEYHAPWEFEHAFAFDSCKNIVLKNSSGNYVWGDGVSIGGTTTELSENIEIINCEFKNPGRQGVAIYNSIQVTIDGNLIHNANRSAIDLENYASTGTINEIVIKNNRMSCENLIIAASGGGQVDNIYVLNNEFYGEASFVRCSSKNSSTYIRNNWQVIGNKRTSGGTSSKISSSSFRDVDNVIYKDNIDYARRAAISFSNCGGKIEVENNDFGLDNSIKLRDMRTEVKVRNNEPRLNIIKL